MKIYHFVIACIFIVANTFAAEQPDSEIVRICTDLDSLHRVTDEPYLMLDSTITFCRPPDVLPHNVHEGFAEAAYCNVYVNELAEPTMLAGRGEYAVGSLIVKSKLRSKAKADIELFTVMRKMGQNYDPENGNWEYSVVDGRSKRVYARGKIDSCIGCHSEYRDTDFVTRTYLRQD